MRRGPTGQVIALLAWVTLCPPWGASASAAERTPLPPFEAVYSLSRDGIRIGTVVANFERPAPDRYTYRTHTDPSGFLALFRNETVTESSEGEAASGGFRPTAYSYHHESNDGGRNLTVQFDWAEQRATVDSGDSRWSLALEPGTLDKLVVQLALMEALHAGQATPFFTVADGGHLKEYQYRAYGRETLTLAQQPIDTVRVRRFKQRQPSHLTLWCAPSLHYLPVRLDRQRGDETYRMELESITGLKINPALSKGYP
jgi:hypothetical protein